MGKGCDLGLVFLSREVRAWRSTMPLSDGVVYPQEERLYTALLASLGQVLPSGTERHGVLELWGHTL